MKTKKTVYFFLMFLPLLITLAALPFLPESVPAHYDFAGEVDRWGSKYESLLFPAVTVLMGLFMLWMAKIAAKDEENGKNNEKTVFYTGMGISVWFTVMHCYFLYNDFKHVQNLNETKVDINQLFCILLGICIVIIGSFMPKLKNNLLIGLRTPRSMKNDITWKKCQRFAGISFMVCGVLVTAAGIFLGGYAAMLVCIGILLADAVICTVYSYKISKKY